MFMVFIMGCVWGALVSAIAVRRGGEGFLWFCAGFLCMPLALLVLFCLPNKKKEAEAAQKREDDERRHREMLAMINR